MVFGFRWLRHGQHIRRGRGRRTRECAAGNSRRPRAAPERRQKKEALVERSGRVAGGSAKSLEIDGRRGRTRAGVGAPVFHRAERLDVRQGPVQEHGLRGGEGRLGQRRGRLRGRGRLKVLERCSRATRGAEMPRMPRTLVGRVGTHVPLESAPQGVVDADLRDTRGEPGSAGFGMVSRARPEAGRSRPPPFSTACSKAERASSQNTRRTWKIRATETHRLHVSREGRLGHGLLSLC